MKTIKTLPFWTSFTFDKCTPKLLCIPEHSMQRVIPRLMLAHLGSGAPQSQQWELPGMTRSCSILLDGLKDKYGFIRLHWLWSKWTNMDLYIKMLNIFLKIVLCHHKMIALHQVICCLANTSGLCLYVLLAKMQDLCWSWYS